MTRPFSFPFQLSAAGSTYPAAFVPHEEDGFLDVVVDDVRFTLVSEGGRYGLKPESDEQARIIDHLRASLKLTSDPETFWFVTVPDDAYQRALATYEQTS